MQLKSSYYNIIYEISGKKYVINTLNCAMAEIDESFLSVVRNPNEERIINNKELASLRDAMKENGFLVEEDVCEQDLLKFEHFKTQYSRDELSLTISPTMLCNFDCPYCFEDKSGGIMSDEVANALIEFVTTQLDGVKKIRVVWFGGEPLLAQEKIWFLSEKLISLADSLGIDYSAYIVSNTFLATEKVAKKFVQYKIDSIQTTIDGMPEYHNKRRFLKGVQASDTFNTIIENIRTLRKHNINVNIRINVDKTNIDQAERLVDYLTAIGYKDVKFSMGQVLPVTNRCGDFSDNCLSTEDFSDYTNEFYKVLLRNKIDVYDKYPFYPVPKCNYCSADHINSFYILPDGRICKCWDEVDEDVIGNVFDGICYSMQSTHNMSKWMLSAFLEDKECMQCKYLPICMGGCPYLRKKNGMRACEKWKWGLKGAVQNIVGGF